MSVTDSLGTAVELLARLMKTVGLLVVLQVIGTAVYNIYWHPLSKYHGHTSWVAFRIFSVISLLRGNLVHDIQRLHENYGPFVRVAPNEISVAHVDGWKDIYAVRQGHKPFPKNPIWWGGKSTGRPESLINAEDPADHARMRRLIDPAFSPRAVEAQELIVQSYMDDLIEKLREGATAHGIENGGQFNIVDWYNFTTFDIVGDLGFGESFYCLKNSRYHPWVANIFSQFKLGSWFAAARQYPWLFRVLLPLIPTSVAKPANNNVNSAKEKIHRRLNLESERNDFMTPVIRNNDEKGMTISEIEGTFNTVIMAGSETTATILSGVTNYLTQDPITFNKLAHEVRAAFDSEEKISFAGVKDLQYLNAVIKEGMRMCPPTPAGLPRVVPDGGDMVCGHWFPGGTHISLHQWSTYRSSSNFHAPNSFIPERWLKASIEDPSSQFYNDQRQAVQIFSLGPRNCIGKNLAWAELRLILARMVWNFDISPAIGLDGEPQLLDWTKQKTWVLVSKEPFEVKLVSLRNAADPSISKEHS